MVVSGAGRDGGRLRERAHTSMNCVTAPSFSFFEPEWCESGVPVRFFQGICVLCATACFRFDISLTFLLASVQCTTRVGLSFAFSHVAAVSDPKYLMYFSLVGYLGFVGQVRHIQLGDVPIVASMEVRS